MSEQAACLAVLGTGSDVGKSIVTTALCRIFANRGFRVAPFKAQNMSNNSGVTPEGAEMGRAQIVQAEAARIATHVDMNPVLLKPVSDLGSQVVLNGTATKGLAAKTQAQAQAIGYVNVGKGNAAVQPTTIAYYRTGQDAAAKQVAADLGAQSEDALVAGSTIESAAVTVQPDVDVVLVLGG